MRRRLAIAGIVLAAGTAAAVWWGTETRDEEREQPPAAVPRVADPPGAIAVATAESAPARHAGPTERDVVGANAERVRAAIAGEIRDGEGMALESAPGNEGEQDKWQASQHVFQPLKLAGEFASAHTPETVRAIHQNWGGCTERSKTRNGNREPC